MYRDSKHGAKWADLKKKEKQDKEGGMNPAFDLQQAGNPLLASATQRRTNL